MGIFTKEDPERNKMREDARKEKEDKKDEEFLGMTKEQLSKQSNEGLILCILKELYCSYLGEDILSDEVKKRLNKMG